MLVGCATLAALFPFVGTIVYMIVRPPEYLEDVRLRELEMQAAEARLLQLDYQLCPHCEYEVKGDFLRCPNCMRKLKDRCTNCGKAVDPAWQPVPVLRGRDGRRPTTSNKRRRAPPAQVARRDRGRAGARVARPARRHPITEPDRGRDPWTGP